MFPRRPISHPTEQRKRNRGTGALYVRLIEVEASHRAFWPRSHLAFDYRSGRRSTNCYFRRGEQFATPEIIFRMNLGKFPPHCICGPAKAPAICSRWQETVLVGKMGPAIARRSMAGCDGTEPPHFHKAD